MPGDRTALSTADAARSRAVAYLLAARALRDFGDGFVAVLLPVYLIALGFSPLEIGAIATAALLGSALLTLGIGMIGSRHDRQRLLLAGASLMTATGVAFAFVHDFALLLVVAFAGTINPSAGSVSVFVPLEHAVLSGEVSDRRRTGMFARYSLIGALSAAFGALAAASPQYLSAAGVEQLTAIKAMFVLLRPARRRRLPALRQDSPTSAARRARDRPAPSGHRGTSSTGSPRSSASTPSPAASSSSRCWRSGSSSASICR